MNNSEIAPERISKASKDKGANGVAQSKKNPRSQQPQNNNSDTEMEPPSDIASEKNQNEANDAEEVKAEQQIKADVEV